MSDDQKPPDPEVRPKIHHRKFSTKFKLEILRKVDQTSPGEVGALLRKEALYTSHIDRWKKQREKGQLDGHGPSPKSSAKPSNKRLNALEAEIQKLREQLEHANTD